MNLKDNEMKHLKTIDKLKRKYGPNVVSRAVSYTPAATARERAGLIAGHKK